MDTAAMARAIREQKKQAAENAEAAKLQAERAERAQQRKALLDKQSKEAWHDFVCGLVYIFAALLHHCISSLSTAIEAACVQSHSDQCAQSIMRGSTMQACTSCLLVLTCNIPKHAADCICPVYPGIATAEKYGAANSHVGLAATSATLMTPCHHAYRARPVRASTKTAADPHPCTHVHPCIHTPWIPPRAVTQ
jgi:hypothetical protein